MSLRDPDAAFGRDPVERNRRFHAQTKVCGYILENREEVAASFSLRRTRVPWQERSDAAISYVEQYQRDCRAPFGRSQ